MNMKPLLETIQTPLDRTFRVYAHDYPFVYSGWHYHPEYELHLVRRSSGQFYVGTFAGDFAPGNLVITGPNLPHMWVSGAEGRDADDRIAGRDLVLQMGSAFAERCVAEFSDCAHLARLLEASRAGIEFSAPTAQRAAKVMEALLDATGFKRMALFFELFGLLEADADRRSLSLKGVEHGCSQPKRLERILSYIAEHFNDPNLSCQYIASMEKMEPSAFSRLFERHIHCTCLEYINRLRVYKACQLLSETGRKITSIGMDVGYKDLSTFNRNFLRLIGDTPTAFRLERRPAEIALAAAKPMRAKGDALCISA